MFTFKECSYGDPCATCEEPAEEEDAPPVYLLERSLRETWLGKAMADRNIRLYGWTAMSYTFGTTSFSNAPMYFNDQPNHFQLNQNWIHFEKAIDTSKDQFQWGWVTDGIVPGTEIEARTPGADVEHPVVEADRALDCRILVGLRDAPEHIFRCTGEARGPSELVVGSGRTRQCQKSHTGAPAKGRHATSYAHSTPPTPHTRKPRDFARAN